MKIYNKILILFLGILVCSGMRGGWAEKVTADDVGKIYLRIINQSGLNLTKIPFYYNNKHRFSSDLENGKEILIKLENFKRILKREEEFPYHTEDWKVNFEELDISFYSFFNASKKILAQKETIESEFSLCDSIDLMVKEDWIVRQSFEKEELTYDKVDLYFVTITLRSERYDSSMQIQQKIYNIGDEI